MKRQRGRGRKPGGGGGGGNHGNRPLESNGPEVKIRGTAAQIFEKYSQYARDAQSSGDRVKYENYLQHAEHYYRVMLATMPRERMFPQPQEGGTQPQLQESGMQPQQQPGGEDQQPQDTLKVMDEQVGEDVDDGDDLEDDDGARGDDESEVPVGVEDRQEGGQGHGHGRGRRRRGRRRHHDGHQGDRPNVNASGGADTEARSALDSLARKQGALAGD